MAKDSLMVKQIEFIVVVRRIKILGITISVGIIAIYFFGIFVAKYNVREDFDIINLTTLLLLIFIVPLTLFIKNIILRQVNLSNFTNKYFNAHVIPFAILDFGALICITTNLFVNGNILYATIGFVISLIGIFLNFPKEEDFGKLKS